MEDIKYIMLEEGIRHLIEKLQKSWNKGRRDKAKVLQHLVDHNKDAMEMEKSSYSFAINDRSDMII
jgi:hypothetical protein